MRDPGDSSVPPTDSTPCPHSPSPYCPLNEASQIEAYLKSAAFVDQVLVVDSGSADHTVALAQALDRYTSRYNKERVMELFEVSVHPPAQPKIASSSIAA